MEAWRWVGRKGSAVPKLSWSYVRVRPTGVYVSMRADEVPWPRASLPVEVGFAPGRVAIRRAEDGRTLSFGYARSRWSGQITGAWIAEEARRYGIPIGVALPARWDAEAGMIVAEVPEEGAQSDGSQAAQAG